MNAFKLNKIIEYIKQYDFCFDIWDLEDNFNDILLEYKILDDFTKDEIEQLRKELLPMAERFQEGEIAMQSKNINSPEHSNINCKVI